MLQELSHMVQELQYEDEDLLLLQQKKTGHVCSQLNYVSLCLFEFESLFISIYACVDVVLIRPWPAFSSDNIESLKII